MAYRTVLNEDLMIRDDLIATLNDLIETSKDGEAGFRTCAEDVMGLQLKSMMTNRSQRCAASARELQALILTLGGDAEDDSSFSGTLHRRWIDIRSAVLGTNNEAILGECERGEVMALRGYKNALASEMPASVRQVVERQYRGVQQNHDQIKLLRDQMRLHQ